MKTIWDSTRGGPGENWMTSKSLRRCFVIACCVVGASAAPLRAQGGGCNCEADRNIDLNVALVPEPDPGPSGSYHYDARRHSRIETAAYERPWRDSSLSNRWDNDRRWNDDHWNDERWDDDVRSRDRWSENRWESDRQSSDRWASERRSRDRWDDDRWNGERWSDDRTADSRWKNDRWSDTRPRSDRWSDDRWNEDRWEREAPRPQWSRTARSYDYVQVHSESPHDFSEYTEAPVPDAQYLEAPSYESSRDWNDSRSRRDYSRRTAYRSSRYDGDRCDIHPYRHHDLWDCDDEVFTETPTAALVWQTMSSRRY
jgi:hypothetical protein